ncbi:HAD superfamily hydrolase (TIGR01484 family) [Kineococcus xinjiangensis]|uniref:HAD superfamily hydrolase (TIGR01484 family) n=1 Tax=Kineococcus xinjiangensis TaxID=512762 RepID=A0A2S6IGA0_9ACTN|nr:HAD family hydrolase [Kineococcus xinjiangensis]PPK93180.1 HAD superfamily hydrolase (TIGR01484 family) [Kineococcus xinjiangensis]
MTLPRLVALDIDGTILDHDERLSDRVRDAVQALARTGTHVVIATGRSLHGALPVLDRLGLARGYAVCSNGSVTVRLDPGQEKGYEVVSLRTFDPTPAVELLHEHLPNALYAVEVLGRGYKLTAPFPDGELTGDIQIVPFDELFAEPAMRVVVRSPEHTPQEFVELVQRVGLHGAAYSVGWTAWLDLAPEGVTKASALDAVRSWLHVDPAETLAAGDGRNDIEMLQWAARSVAMGNGPAEVHAAADEVCGDVVDDGLADVLERLLAAAGTPS